MLKLGYKLMSEEHGPTDLVRNAQPSHEPKSPTIGDGGALVLLASTRSEANAAFADRYRLTYSSRSLRTCSGVYGISFVLKDCHPACRYAAARSRTFTADRSMMACSRGASASVTRALTTAPPRRNPSA